MTNRDYIMNISVKDFINEYCLLVGYTEKDFVRLMILFKADDDRVNKWLNSEMIGSRILTNAERIKSRSIEELAYFFSREIFKKCEDCPAYIYCTGDCSCQEAVKKWLESEVHFVEQAPIVEEHKQGHWIQHNNIISCSECIWDMYWEEGNKELNYCPNCGAKMENNGGNNNAE